jgi:hypothetical protein
MTKDVKCKATYFETTSKTIYIVGKSDVNRSSVKWGEMTANVDIVIIEH